ncbi:MAG: M64 family metallopeptidase [Candidatus Levybacteria bacterium]|nr:M64 family metallopeptidase [Candidatus Levybacteria bacterium]
MVLFKKILALKYFKAIAFLTFIFFAVPLTVFVAQQQQTIKQKAMFKSPSKTFESISKNYQQALKEQLIEPVGEILEISLSYDESKTPQVSLGEIRRLNGYVPHRFQDLTSDAYTLKLLSNTGETINTIRFEIPKKVIVEQVGEITLKQVNFSENASYSTSISSIALLDSKGNVIITQSILNIPKIENQPDFKVINGADVVNAQKQGSKLNMNILIPKLNQVFAQTEGEPKKVNIAIIGDRYTTPGDTDKFNKDFAAITDHLVRIEPFKTRAKQINFIPYPNTPNTVDLECKKDNKYEFISCNNDLARSLLKGDSHNVFVILVNDLDARANASFSGDARITNFDPDRLPAIFVHELGHALAKLYDEYVEHGREPSENAQIPAGEGENCAESREQITAKWGNLVGTNDIYAGCNYTEKWYRPSTESMMQYETPYFNAVSQKKINKVIDSIAGSFSPIPAENKEIAYLQLWVDDDLTTTSYPYPEFPLKLEGVNDSKLDVYSSNLGMSLGKHTLQLKAYDGLGNMIKESNKVTVIKYQFPIKIGNISQGQKINESTEITLEVGDEYKPIFYYMKIFIDEEPISGESVKTYNSQKASFTLDPDEYKKAFTPEGGHVLSVVAYDKNNVPTNVSDPIRFYTPSTTFPSLSSLTPEIEKVKTSDPFLLNVYRKFGGNAKKVGGFVNSQFYGGYFEPKYYDASTLTLSARRFADGEYSYYIRVYDSSGKSAFSNKIKFYVKNKEFVDNPCPLKEKGDADCNGKINSYDFVILKNEFMKAHTAYNTEADFNGDGPVDEKDMQSWKDSMGDSNLQH